jgi:hypothetical protein
LHAIALAERTTMASRIEAQPAPTRATSSRAGAFLYVVASVPAAMLEPVSAHACPNCAAGVQARREVWGEDFAFHLLVALLPFLIIGAICVRLEVAGAKARSVRRISSATNHDMTEEQ